MGVTKETIQKMAEAIQYIEHAGHHSWESCTQTARDRALRQASECARIVDEMEVSQKKVQGP